jgi:APA family basic amino acid/polyamine antiporter
MAQSLWSQLARRKSLDQLNSHEGHDGPKLKKALTAFDVTTHGVAAIIGTGVFVLTGIAAAEHAGPGIIVSFLLSAIVCACVAFAYAELSSMIPVSGSAYTYAYATLGEFIAWCIGWDLLLEYCMGASAVAIGWSAYLQNLLFKYDIVLKDYMQVAPAKLPLTDCVLFTALILIGTFGLLRAYKRFKSSAYKTLVEKTISFAISTVSSLILALGLFLCYTTLVVAGSIDIFAVAIVAFLDIWLILGVTYTARMTACFVFVKLAAILVFVAVGISHIDTANYSPFLPYGYTGIITGAAVVFFAFIGFDAVSTLAEECKDPKRDMPRGIIASLTISSILYVAVAVVMTGVLSYKLLGGGEGNEDAAAMAKVLDHIGSKFASGLVSVGALLAMSSVLLVSLFGQSRVMMSVSRDGLISPIFSRVNKHTQTPVYSILIWGFFAALTAAFIPINELAELTSIGTLAAFVVCCVGVIVLRIREPNRERKFSCPGYPVVPALGAILSLVLMFSLPWLTWIRFIAWFAVGVIIYFAYGMRNSALRKKASQA